MQDLSDEGRAAVEAIARRHGTSLDAVQALLAALVAGGGTMAQFNVPELGGMGQWSQGGMTMVGDMFNHGLKARVDALCADLAGLLQRQDLFRPRPEGGPSHAGGRRNWWPDGLGHPSSTGAQNNLRYAVFPDARRLAIDAAGQVTLYDTADHRIGGVSQQQGDWGSLSFNSQHGTVRLADFPVVRDGTEPPSEGQLDRSGWNDAGGGSRPVAGTPQPGAPRGPEREVTPGHGGPAATAGAHSGAPRDARQADDILTTLDRLAEMRDRGVLTEAEFAQKKAELLSRL